MPAGGPHGAAGTAAPRAARPDRVDVRGGPPPRRPDPLVAAVALRRATAFVLLGALTTAVGGDAGAWLAAVGAVLFALCGGVGCLRAARRTTGGVRRGWTALAVASWAWGAGRLVALLGPGVLGDGDRYPSAGDVAGLAFPLVALVALCLLAPRSTASTVPRRLLDGLTVGCALALASWVLVVDPVAHAEPGSVAAVAVWLAYPIGDAVLLTVLVLTVAQDRRLPWRWAALGAAVLAMAVSNVATALLSAAGTRTAGTMAEWGWWAGFCLLATAGATVRASTGPDRVPPPAAPTAPGGWGRPGLLPYLPLAVAAGAVVVEYARGHSLDAVATAMTVLLVTLVLARQYTTLRDNHRLARVVARRESELHHLAFHDALTGLANRALFLDRLGHALDLATREPRRVSVVFVDLDGFKAVNDTLGHAAGDRLLIDVARRMRASIRSTDTVARLGGDEFAVLVEQGADATVVARTLLAALRRPFTLDGREVAVSASIGVATADPRLGPEQASALVHRADVAMYAVKTSGKGGVQAHSAAVHDGPRRAVPTEHRAVAAGVARDAIRVVFRPVVHAGDGCIAALEAVAQWAEGAAPPGALEVAACPPLTPLLLEQSCRQLALWNSALGHHRLRVIVPLGVAELDAELPGRADRVLARYRLAPGQLTLQLDDGALPDRSAVALDALHRLRHLGVRLGLGGLGAGYATLAWLSGAPLDTIKIDSELVSDIDHDLGRCRLLHGVLELARHLGLRSVADGVERTGQLLELRRLGCDLVQGHLVAGPATAAELTPVVLARQALLPRRLVVPAPGPAAEQPAPPATAWRGRPVGTW